MTTLGVDRPTQPALATHTRGPEAQVTAATTAPIVRTKPVLTIVMPAYEEAKTIDASLRRVYETLTDFGQTFEVILVSDGCTDGTAEVATATGFTDLTVLHNPQNKGKGHALRTGCAEASGDYIVFLDSDLDLHPISITWLLRILEDSGADVVVGSKAHPDSDVCYPWMRRLQSDLFRALTRTLFRLRVRDTQTGVKAFRAEPLKEVIDLARTDGWAFDLDLLVNLNDRGRVILEGPISLDFQFTSSIRVLTAIPMLRDTLGIAMRRRSARLKQA